MIPIILQNNWDFDLDNLYNNPMRGECKFDTLKQKVFCSLRFGSLLFSSVLFFSLLFSLSQVVLPAKIANVLVPFDQFLSPLITWLLSIESNQSNSDALFLNGSKSLKLWYYYKHIKTVLKEGEIQGGCI